MQYHELKSSAHCARIKTEKREKALSDSFDRRRAKHGAARQRRVGTLTIYDIAREAGVSITTVSRVINGKGKVSEGTRSRVQAILTASRYVPNQVAQGLASRATKTVGVLTVDIRDIHHASTAYTIEQEMSKAGYSTIMCNLGGSWERMEEYVSMLTSRQISGVFFIGSVFANAACEQVIRTALADVPVVIVNGILPVKNVYGVLVDERQGTADAVELLIRQGRRHIALMCSSNTLSDMNKYLGYAQTMAKHGLREIWIESERSIEGGACGTKQLLAEHPELDAIQYAEDLTAVGGVHALHELGIAVPQQVAVVGCNASMYCSLCYPTLTSINNKLCETGAMAAGMMVRLLAGDSDVPKTVSLDCGLMERDSTAPKTGGA